MPFTIGDSKSTIFLDHIVIWITTTLSEGTRYLALAAIIAGTVYQFVSGRIKPLTESETVDTLLPACDLPTREELAPGRKLIDADATTSAMARTPRATPRRAPSCRAPRLIRTSSTPKAPSTWRTAPGCPAPGIPGRPARRSTAERLLPVPECAPPPAPTECYR